MIGERIKKARMDRGYSLEELGKLVGKSYSTVSRYENDMVSKMDPNLLNKFADALGLSISYLLEEPGNYLEVHEVENLDEGEIIKVVVENDDMSPELPGGAVVKVRGLMPNEKLQEESFYCIEFNNQTVFRMVVDDEQDGLGFLPNDRSERRIAYDRDYVRIIGKAIAMKVIFEDKIEYE